jgi:hypothetical protein
MMSISRRKMLPRKRTASVNRNPTLVDTNPIPSFVASVTSNHTYRYQCTGSPLTGQGITRSNLLNSQILNVSGSTTNYRTINAIRINRIEMYAAPLIGNSSSPTTVQVEWVSTYGPSKVISDTTISASLVAVVKSKPPQSSLASYWSLRNSNESDTLMFLTAPVNTIVDLNVSIVYQDDSVANAVSTSSTGTIGVLYATYLDGPRSGASLVPVSLPSIN